MDVLEIIRADHRLVESLFSEIEQTGDTYKLYECFNQLYEALNVHAEVEEQVFYPAIRKGQDTKELLDDAQKEHEEARQILEELGSLSPTKDEFKQKIAALKQVVQHHVQEEENEIFSQARACMNEEERSQIGSKFVAVKSKLQSEISLPS